MKDANADHITKRLGRPKGILPAMAVIALRLPTDLADQIDEWGAERGMTRSASLRRWIENGVKERWKPNGDETKRGQRGSIHDRKLGP